MCNPLTIILLSGANSDGVESLNFVRETGGTIIIQEPGSAEVDYTPQRPTAGRVRLGDAAGGDWGVDGEVKY